MYLNNTNKAFIYRNCNLVLRCEMRAKNLFASGGLSLFLEFFALLTPVFEQEKRHLYHFLAQLSRPSGILPYEPRLQASSSPILRIRILSSVRSPSLGASNYPIFLSRRFHRPVYF